MSELADILRQRDQRLADALAHRRRLALGLARQTRAAADAAGSPLGLAGAFAGGFLIRRLQEWRRDDEPDPASDAEAVAEAVVARLHEEPVATEDADPHPWLSMAGQMALTIVSRMVAQRLLAAWTADATAAGDTAPEADPDGTPAGPDPLFDT